MNKAASKSSKNLCITVPTTTTLHNDELEDVTNNVVINETALRFLDSVAVSPTAKNMKSASSFFRDTISAHPKSVQSTTRKGEHELKIVIGKEKMTHKAELKELMKKQETEALKRQKIQHSLEEDSTARRFDVTVSPFYKAYYRIGAQSGTERINADTVPLPPITNKLKIVEKFTEKSATKNHAIVAAGTSLPGFGSTSSMVPDLRNGRISGVLLASAAFKSYNYDLDDEKTGEKDAAHVIDTIATYVPSATANDIKEMKRLYMQIEELSDGSGYTYCVGGLSFYEIMLRVVTPKKPLILQDSLYTIRTGMPFNPVRRQIISLCQKISFERAAKARELLFDHKVRMYPRSFDDVWPSGVVELLIIIGETGRFSSIEHLDLPVCNGSNYSIKLAATRDGDDPERQAGKTPKSTQRTNMSPLTRQTTRSDTRQRQQDQESVPAELVYSIQDQLFKHLDSMFFRSVLGLIGSLKDTGFLAKNDPAHAKLLDLYVKHQFNKPASPVTDPEGREWVSCHITEKTEGSPSFSDIYRYLEGFILVADWALMHNGLAPDEDECSAICTKIISPITASLALCIARFFLHVYFRPFVVVLSEGTVRDEIQEMIVSKESTTISNLVLNLLRTEGKALNELELSKYKNRHYEPLMKKICARREEAIIDRETQQQLHNIHVLVTKLQETSVLPNIVDQDGARELIEYVSSVMYNVNMSTLSTSLFRVLRGKYIAKFKYRCTPPTPAELRRHLSYHVHMCILAAKVAALKVVEELYPLHIHTHIGRTLEYEALEQIDMVIDPTGIFRSSFNRLMNV